MIDVDGKRVLVVGLGVSGASAAETLATMGADVSVTEAGSGVILEERAEVLSRSGVAVEIGGHDLALGDYDLVVVSPGIPPGAEVMVELRRSGATIIGEIELAAQLATCDLLAITGTNGKTTTTALLAAMLKEGGVPSMAAGNIGTPLVDAIKMVAADGAIALEVSSFQLATITDFHPKVAIVLNVAEDHTDWHGAFDSYVQAKARITENQGENDVFIYNAEDPVASSIAEGSIARKVPFSSMRAPEGGIGSEGGAVMWQGNPVFSRDDCALGWAGFEDAIAAAGAALEYGVDPRAVVRAIKGFQGLGHRLEVVAEVDGVSFVDDSKATNPHATLAAVKGYEDVVLIAGGRAKGIDLSPLKQTVPPVSAVIAIGEAAPMVEEAFSPLVPVERAGSMDEAVRKASAHAVRGGTVLLSPGCASLDMFSNYAERGQAFAAAVRALISSDDVGHKDGPNDGEDR